MTTLQTPLAVAEPSAVLPGPDWLRHHRERAVAELAGAELPTTDEEVWRYSRIGELDLERWDLGTLPAPDGPLPAGVRAVLRTLPPHGGGLVTVGGHLAHRHLDAELHDRGVVLGPLADADGGEELLASLDPAVDVFGLLNDALAPEPLVLRVPPGCAVGQPIVVVHWHDAAGHASFPRLVVDVGADAEVTVLEVEASAEGPALVAPRLDLRVAASARLRYLGLQDVGASVWRIAAHRACVEAQGSLLAAQVALGGAYARTRTDCRLVGRGSTGDLLALYYGAGQQMLDFRTFQEHEAPDTTSNLLFKGAVGGHSRSVYTGLIRVHPEARGTNAFQTNRNLKLGEHAWAESVPNLEIENNDVRCSHASTVGPVDADERFYLESRGVPPDEAERLIVTGFFDEVLDQLPVPELRPAVRDQLIARYQQEVEVPR